MSAEATHWEPSRNDVRGWLATLKQRLADTSDTTCVEKAIAGMSCAVDQLLEEHAGMAEELLAVYEQLGVVFEVTRKLPEAGTEAGGLEVLLECLSHSFHQYRVSLVYTGDKGSWVVHGESLVVEEWLRGQVGRARLERRVFVIAPPPESGFPGAAEVLIAPVFSGDQFLFALVMVRRNDAPEFRVSDMSVIESLAAFCGDIVRNQRLLDEVRGMSISIVHSLVNAVDQKDPYTFGHSVRVAFYATMLGRSLCLVDCELRMLQWSALLHDIGKIGIRDDVLKKTGKLTAQEFDHIKEHPVRSHQIVKGVPQLGDAIDGVLRHHEHYDGSGYPSGLAGRDIPLQARIVQIADVFDALTSTRSYRVAFDWPKALDIMSQEAGTTLDPMLQKVFDQLIREELGDDPDNWSRLLDRANAFTQESSDVEESPDAPQ